jgi:hypothetical protein
VEASAEGGGLGAGLELGIGGIGVEGGLLSPQAEIIIVTAVKAAAAIRRRTT